MKIRLLNDSIRIRISQGELTDLADGKEVETVTHFPAAKLVYKISPTQAEQMKVDLQDYCIHLLVPESMLNALVTSDQVGFDRSIPVAGEGQLFVLFEKDFKCLTPRTEDESDLFNNPLEKANC